VGSEMCIRDSPCPHPPARRFPPGIRAVAWDGSL